MMRPKTPSHHRTPSSPSTSDSLSLPFTTNPLLKDDITSSSSPETPKDCLPDQFPASFRLSDDLHAPSGIPPLDLLTDELSPRRLQQRIRYLWLAGRPVPPRPLHHQLLLGREIFLSERIDLHLVWGGGRIFVKPVPRYLLNPEFWREYLLSGDGEEEREHLRQCAMGFLLSYVALVSYESDFRIAMEKGLLPRQISWGRWRRFVREILHAQEAAGEKDGGRLWGDVAERFIYGELRLNRLNMIEVVLRGPLSRGFLATWTSFGSFYQYSSAAIVAGAAYILLILSAMQVGLGTKLAEDEVFQSASYGFTVFSILGPLGAVLAVVLAFVVAVLYNAVRTKSFEARRSAQLGRTWGSKQTSRV
ncbi:hypothetical protein QBC34DRAFT_391818 [Podospora aff. communis PSN243]|uniref:Uncharacterized protein n=1 Tax=Podospora aff. communis PSN243 TaxID=3040156 RepID=A0AAV9H2G1_9PEZI|nr:hypothetical protein QBC34DRAFT_391818 [Podospora aff. communis PSN243]